MPLTKAEQDAGWREMHLPISLPREDAEAMAKLLAKTHEIYTLDKEDGTGWLAAFPCCPLGAKRYESYRVTYRETPLGEDANINWAKQQKGAPDAVSAN